jgi:nitrogen fixation protein NifX
MRRLRLVDTAVGAVAGATDLGSPEGHMKIAFATQDLKTLDAHFGGARNIAIYDVSPEGYRFLEAVRFDSHSDENGVHSEPEEDRIGPRVDALEGCAVLFVLAIGGPAAARVVNSKIHPVKLPRPEPISQILDRLQTMLAGSPPPWLRKAMQEDTKALDFLDDEEDERCH